MESVKVKVLFKREMEYEFNRGYETGLYAVLIGQACNHGYAWVYSKSGQHSMASLEYIRQCKNADTQDSDRVNMLQELRRVGYDPQVVRRMSYK